MIAALYVETGGVYYGLPVLLDMARSVPSESLFPVPANTRRLT